MLLLGMFFVMDTLPQRAFGDTVEQIQQKITDQQTKITALEKEIAKYESTLTTLGSQKKTLESEVQRLDISRKKIATDIAVTQNKITKANLELEELGGAIQDKNQRINDSVLAVTQSLQTLYHLGDVTVVEELFTHSGLVDAWAEVDALHQLQRTLRTEVKDLKTTKVSLTIDFNETQKQKTILVSLKKDLAGQKLVLDQNRAEQAVLLSQTKNQESAYQKLLATKQQAKIDFERELSNYEASLNYTFDPTKIPKAGAGVLSFPLDPDYLSRCQSRANVFKNIYCITQYFGNTAFAQSGAYNGQGHNGVDFGAPEGTRVVAALFGTVAGTGNTDVQAGCYSYGKWVLVRHTNGLATVYAHLSVISVSQGETVATGSLLGYSGKTGYATGPHLHFGVYVGSAVKVIRLGDVKVKTNCANAYMPVAPTEAYLNPIQYL